MSRPWELLYHSRRGREMGINGLSPREEQRFAGDPEAAARLIRGRKIKYGNNRLEESDGRKFYEKVSVGTLRMFLSKPVGAG